MGMNKWAFPYSFMDCLSGMAVTVFGLLGDLTLTVALGCGKGGAVQAVYSLQNLVPLLLDVIFFKVKPSLI